MNEALQNLSSGGLVICDGFAAIPAWGWDSTQDTILGIPIHADVNNAIPVIPSGGQIIPSLHLTFANGWVMALNALFADRYAAGGPSMIVGTAYLGEGNHVFDRTSYHSIRGNLDDLAVLESDDSPGGNLPYSQLGRPYRHVHRGQPVPAWDLRRDINRLWGACVGDYWGDLAHGRHA